MNNNSDILGLILTIGMVILVFYVFFGIFLPLTNTMDAIAENVDKVGEYIPEVANYKIVIDGEDYWVENYTTDDGLITIERYWDNTGSLLDLENYFKYYTSPTIISSNFTIIPLK